METTVNNSERIINSWSLFAFAELKGADIAVGICTASDGTTFPAVTFSKGNNRTFVDFGKSLANGLTFEEICAQVNDLQIVELQTAPDVLERRKQKALETGKEVQLETYKLCTKGESNWHGGNLFAALGMH